MDAENTRARQVLDDLLETDSGMNGWELDFIEDMDERRDHNWSPAQIDKLDQIYGKVC